MPEGQTITASLFEVLGEFAHQERLPATFGQRFVSWYAGITRHLATRAAAAERPLLVGVSGCQGSGKSTLARAMALIAEAVFDTPATALSLDDFYLTQNERQQLARSVHPLFATRGVPGTHDLGLLNSTLEALAMDNGSAALPSFDKARDERTKSVQWRQVCAPVGLIFLEGWCVGIPPQQAAELVDPVNQTELTLDSEGHWRQAINSQLQNDYATLFAKLDALLFLKAPDFSAVSDWRWEQEQRMSDAIREGAHATTGRSMTRDEVGAFILHYQRLTEHALDTLPQRADATWELARDRCVRRMQLTAVSP
jgi:D-glycerate 3-kinase